MDWEGHESYMRMLKLGWKSGYVTGFLGNQSSCDGVSRVWK